MNTVVHKLIDYVLLNAHSTHFHGLYQGKLGIALGLFEIARHLEDEKTEDFAWVLLQETLALFNQNQKVSFDFETGLSGLGYVLLYLIQNGFLDAEFEELFGEYTVRIQTFLKAKSVFTEKDLLSAYYLEVLYRYTKQKEVLDLKNKLLDDVGESLEKQMKTLGTLHPAIINFQMLNQWDRYLKTVSFCSGYTFPESLIDHYVRLYKQGKVTCRFSTGFYMERLFPDKDLLSIAQKLQASAMLNIYPETLTLAQQIDLLYLLNEADAKRYEQPIGLLEKDLWDGEHPLYEKNILSAIPPRNLIAGYGSGISRLLLYEVYRKSKQNGEDCSRFKALFF